MKNTSMKLTFIITPLMVVLVLGSYFYSLWVAEVKRREALPQDNSAALTRDLLKYHEKVGAFPEDLRALVGKIWDSKREREFDPSGRVFRHNNVFYLYSRQNAHLFTLWAVPSGEKREEGISWFVTASPEAIRRWKGPAIMDNQVDQLIAQPSIQSLALLGLTEQPATNLKDGNSQSVSVRKNPANANTR